MSLTSFGFIKEVISSRLEVEKSGEKMQLANEKKKLSKLQKNVGIFDPEKVDPHTWLQSWILVCTTEQIHSRTAVILAIRCWRGEALEWLKKLYLNAKRNDDEKKMKKALVFSSSDALEILFRHRWLRNNKKNAFRKICSLKKEEGETFSQFASRVKRTFFNATINDMELMVDTFARGIPQKLGQIVAMLKPKSLDKAVQYAIENSQKWTSNKNDIMEISNYMRERQQWQTQLQFERRPSQSQKHRYHSQYNKYKKRRPIHCYRCGGNHPVRRCPIKICFRCRKLGHVASQCQSISKNGQPTSSQ